MSKHTPYLQYSQAYDEWFDDHSDIFQAELSCLKALLPQGKGLEVGCGSGQFTAPLTIYTGLDPAAPMLQRAREKGIHNLVQGVGEQLPFCNNCFDFTLFVTSLCFVDDVTKCLQEACRVVKRQGYLLIGFINLDSEIGQQYQAHKTTSRFYQQARFLRYSDLEQQLNNCGATILKSCQTLLPDNPLNVYEGHENGGFVALLAQT